MGFPVMLMRLNFNLMLIDSKNLEKHFSFSHRYRNVDAAEKIVLRSLPR